MEIYRLQRGDLGREIHHEAQHQRDARDQRGDEIDEGGSDEPA